MHHHPAQFAVHVHQLLQAQPVQQHITVFGLDDAQQVRVDLALFLFGARTDGQQGKVMIAEHHHAVFAQRMHQPQRFQRLSAAVDQVAAEPQGVLRRIEPDLFQQALGYVIAALQVADRPYTHRSASVSVQGARDGQHEGCDRRGEFGAIVGHHVVMALHRAVLGAEHDT
ncbi:hypothetical protein D3C71_1083410 [compost metagenome]